MFDLIFVIRILVLFLFLQFSLLENAWGGKILRAKVYRVENYGIYPDGTPISQKLQRLTKMVSQNGGGVIKFSSGTYNFGCVGIENGTIKNVIRLYPNVKYVGTKVTKGIGPTIFRANNNSEPFYSMFYTGDNNAKNIDFQNIVFDTYIGRKVIKGKSDLRNAILLATADNIKIIGCKFICDIGSIDARSSHKRTDKDSGDYGLYNLTIENCIFECHVLKEPGYLDITTMPIIGQNVLIKKNLFYVCDTIREKGYYYPNCPIEVSGRNITIVGNVIKGFSNAIDVACGDKYGSNRKIVISNNIINTCRGIGIWGMKGSEVQGIIIDNNTFTIESENMFRWPNSRNAIGFVSHVLHSNNANYKDISIVNNSFKTSNSFYSSLNAERWLIERKDAFNIGYTFEEYYSMIDVGGLSVNRENIKICNNKFYNLQLPAVYIGGRNYSSNYLIYGNSFINSSTKVSMIVIADKSNDIRILKNVWSFSELTDIALSDLQENFISQIWSGHDNLDGYPQSLFDCKLTNLVLEQNKALVRNKSITLNSQVN